MKKSISYEVKLSIVVLLTLALILVAAFTTVDYIAGFSFLGAFFLTAFVVPAVGLELI